MWERTQAATFSGGAGHDIFAPGVAAFGAGIDRVVVGLDDVEVVPRAVFTPRRSFMRSRSGCKPKPHKFLISFHII